MDRFAEVEGWSPEYIHVSIDQPCVEELGQPTVDYPSLTTYFYDELDIIPDFNARILLDSQLMALGYAEYKTHAIKINPILASMMEIEVMEVVAHEGRHMADFASNHPAIRRNQIQSAIWVGGLYAIGWGVGCAVLGSPENLIPGIICAYTGWKASDRWNPLEKRAHQQRHDPSTQEHINDIVFPDRPHR